MDQLYDNNNDSSKPQKIDFNPQAANIDSFQQIQELKKKHSKQELHKHFNELISDDEIRKAKILKRMNDKLNSKKINI